MKIRRGDRVRVRHDDGEIREHEVKYGPWQLCHGEWVLGLVGMSGCYLMSRVVGHEPKVDGWVSVSQILRDKGVEFGPETAVRRPS